MKQCAHFFYFFLVNQSKYLLKSVTDIWYGRSWFCSRVIICCFFHNVKLDEYSVNHCQLSVFILIHLNSAQQLSRKKRAWPYMQKGTSVQCLSRQVKLVALSSELTTGVEFDSSQQCCRSIAVPAADCPSGHFCVLSYKVWDTLTVQVLR